MPREKVDEQLLGCTADAPLLDMPPGEAQLDENFNFTPRTVVKEDTNSLAEVSTIGNLVTTTGAITVADFGYENTMARPLARLVPPGTYPVDRVTAFGRNAAIRVRFTGELPVSWHPAGLPDNEGHVIGIDGGLVCIVDYADYGAMTGRQKAAALNGPDDDTQPTGYTFPAGGTSVGVAAATGWGDGTYPVYWGIDAHGNAAQLVVDFMVLVSDGAEDDDEQDDGFIYVHI
ncbi:hypothetical protein AXK58_19355 [Tsukamurella tyrosinosolvens]|nr:hypothetical protein AXK58_19355 [Tsukamurella tyrosinosolvens]